MVSSCQEIEKSDIIDQARIAMGGSSIVTQAVEHSNFHRRTNLDPFIYELLPKGSPSWSGRLLKPGQGGKPMEEMGLHPLGNRIVHRE